MFVLCTHWIFKLCRAWSGLVVDDLDLRQIFGKNDTHVPPAGRDLIRSTLHEKGVLFSFYEVAWAQRMSFPSFTIRISGCMLSHQLHITNHI